MYYSLWCIHGIGFYCIYFYLVFAIFFYILFYLKKKTKPKVKFFVLIVYTHIFYSMPCANDQKSNITKCECQALELCCVNLFSSMIIFFKPKNKYVLKILMSIFAESIYNIQYSEVITDNFYIGMCCLYWCELKKSFKI